MVLAWPNQGSAEEEYYKLTVIRMPADGRLVTTLTELNITFGFFKDMEEASRRCSLRRREHSCIGTETIEQKL